ncbi:MAG: hypothetical protein Q9224_006220 [Gallowayella concinna]
MSDEAKLEYKFDPTLRIYSPDTENVSLNSIQLHELAILRELSSPVPTAITFICMYFNKKYGLEWTDKQILQAWKIMRDEIENHEMINKGHPLLIWDRTDDYSKRYPREKVEILKEIERVTMADFYQILASELEDSSIEIDMEIERRAFDEISKVTVSEVASIQAHWHKSKNRQWTRKDSELFSHDNGPTFLMHPSAQKSTDENAEDYMKQKELVDKYFADYKEWMSLATADRATMADKPKPSDPKYKYRPKIAKSLAK